MSSVIGEGLKKGESKKWANLIGQHVRGWRRLNKTTSTSEGVSSPSAPLFPFYTHSIMADDNYLSMLNNPVINPPRQQPQQSETQHVAAQLSPSFPAVQQCQQDLQSSARDLILVSETDAEWQNVSAPWSSDTLPSSRQDLDRAGLLIRNSNFDQYERDEEHGFQVQSVADFLERQGKDYDNLLKKLKKWFGEQVKVYFVGNRVTTVLILGLVKGDDGQKALVGLQSELVQT